MEINVGVLGRAPQGRPVGRHGARPESGDILLTDHGADGLVREQRELGHLVRSAEAVEKMDEGNARTVAGHVSDQRQVVRLLAGVAAEQRAAGGAAGHDVLVVAKNGQSLRRERPGADVQRERQQFARDLVKVGDHQQQTLRSREGCRQRAAQQSAVHGAGDATFGLHLDNPRHLAPEVGLEPRRPLVADLGHGRGRGDWINRDQFVEPVGHRSDRFVGITSCKGGFDGRAGHGLEWVG